MAAYTAFRQLVAEQVKGGKPAEPADGIRREKTPPFRKAGAVVKPRHRLARGRACMFFMDIRIHQKTSPFPIFVHVTVYHTARTQNEIWGKSYFFWGESTFNLHKTPNRFT